MEMSMEAGILLAYAFGIFAIYVLGYILLVPVKILLRLVVNSILGGVAILLVNFIGAYWAFHMPLNIISAAIVGIFGVPGTLLLFFWL